MRIMPLCPWCKNFNTLTVKTTCKAFPKGIPEKILYSVTHYPDQPAPGDKGIRFIPHDNRTIAEWKKEVTPLTDDEFEELPHD